MTGKPKKYCPEAIAGTILRAVSNPDELAICWKEFTDLEKPIPPRLLFGLVIFAYCWAGRWIGGQIDPLMSQAYDNVVDIIISRFQEPGKVVRVSDYIRTESEILDLIINLGSF